MCTNEGQRLKLVSLLFSTICFETGHLPKARFLAFRLHWLASEVLGPLPLSVSAEL